MRSLCALLALTVALALTAGVASAEDKPNPDLVPDKMPFDIPFGTAITADQAKNVIAAAEAEAKLRGWKLNIAVVDWAGNLVAFERMDDAQLASIAISQHKARAAAEFRRETKVFEGAVQAGNNTVLTLDGIMASRGGVPLIVDGKIIGAIGCSGGTGTQDEVVAKAGAHAVGK
jgi:uncharacterized protein GlcG (DUF336 family)